jgi:hypothetical protein
VLRSFIIITVGCPAQWEWNRDAANERTNFEAALEQALGRDELHAWLRMMETTAGWSRELQDALDANKAKAANASAVGDELPRGATSENLSMIQMSKVVPVH